VAAVSWHPGLRAAAISFDQDHLHRADDHSDRKRHLSRAMGCGKRDRVVQLAALADLVGFLSHAYRQLVPAS